ncbi:hypothetical protein [Streptomyces sp. NPDC048172]|uniref:hypothetical protein n=1 Tax=Streptomyces sp. NPDC048172 TaxID=3365505 RepID=UPI0037191B0E
MAAAEDTPDPANEALNLAKALIHQARVESYRRTSALESLKRFLRRIGLSRSSSPPEQGYGGGNAEEGYGQDRGPQPPGPRSARGAAPTYSYSSGQGRFTAAMDLDGRDLRMRHQVLSRLQRLIETDREYAHAAQLPMIQRLLSEPRERAAAPPGTPPRRGHDGPRGSDAWYARNLQQNDLQARSMEWRDAQKLARELVMEDLGLTRGPSGSGSSPGRERGRPRAGLEDLDLAQRDKTARAMRMMLFNENNSEYLERYRKGPLPNTDFLLGAHPVRRSTGPESKAPQPKPQAPAWPRPQAPMPNRRGKPAAEGIASSAAEFSPPPAKRRKTGEHPSPASARPAAAQPYKPLGEAHNPLKRKR